MLPRDMWPHSQAYRPLRVEGSTYLLFPSPNSPPVVGPLDVQELSAVTHLPCICVTAAKSLTSFLQATHIPSQHQRPPQVTVIRVISQNYLVRQQHCHWGNLTNGLLFEGVGEEVLMPIVYMKVASKETRNIHRDLQDRKTIFRGTPDHGLLNREESCSPRTQIAKPETLLTETCIHVCSVASVMSDSLQSHGL